MKLRFLNNLVVFFYTYYKKRVTECLVNRREKYPKEVLFDINSRIEQRYFVYMLYCYSQAGYRVFLMCNIHFIGNLTGYAKSVANLKSLRLAYTYKEISAELLQFVNIENNVPIKFKNTITLSLEMMPNGKLICDERLLPYPMIPRLYFSGCINDVITFRNNVRTIKILFSGNQNRLVYDNKFFRQAFGKSNRIEIIDSLKAKLKPNEILIMSPLDCNASIYYNKFVLFEWNRNSFKQIDVPGRIPNTKWLKILSSTDFFLACPGFVQPVCHNLIEAMSVGCIPILEHPEFMFPNLVHMKNAIVFSGDDDLLLKIREVLAMGNDQILRMREAVINYYDNFLSPDALVRKFQTRKPSQKLFFINSDAYFQNIIRK
jgi:hypothetical protein